MKAIPLLFIILTSCATIQNPQNWNDDIAMQKEFQWQGDTITITETN